MVVGNNNNNGNGGNGGNGGSGGNRLQHVCVIMLQEGGPQVFNAEVRDGTAYAEKVGSLCHDYMTSLFENGVPQPDDPEWVQKAESWYAAATAFQEEYGKRNVPPDMSGAMAELRAALGLPSDEDMP